MSITIEVKGTDELLRGLEWAERQVMRKRIQKSVNAAAKFLKPLVKAEAPRGKTGKLRKSISAGQAARGRPAAIVKARPKIAFYRHMVISGTKAHRIRFPDQVKAGVPRKGGGNIQHPGAKANSFIERVGRRYEREAFEIAKKVFLEDAP